MMYQAIFTVVSVITFTITSGFPLKTCEKLRGVKEGVDNYDQYLVKLKDPNDAEYVINLVNQYQTILDQHAFNVLDPSKISKLVLTENPGLLHGILSQQALFLACSESVVEMILPDYPRSHTDAPDVAKPKNVYIGDCDKLVLKEPHQAYGNFSVIFKRKTSLNTLYYIITKMEIAKLNDSSIAFNYYYSVKKGKKMIMMVKMNTKALHMICEEEMVKRIKPKYDNSVTSKRDTEAASNQNLAAFTTANDHCGLPEHFEEFPTFIFVYNRAASLDKVIKSLKRYSKNSAKVQSATALKHTQMVIFKMNRAAYVQACKDPRITLVEYAKPVTLSPPETSVPESTNTDICQHIYTQEDSTNAYTVKLNMPLTVKTRRKRCLKLLKKLNKRNNRRFHAITYPQQSCQNNENDDIKIMTQLNLKALKYVCTMKGLQISVTQSL